MNEYNFEYIETVELFNMFGKGIPKIIDRQTKEVINAQDFKAIRIKLNGEEMNYAFEIYKYNNEWVVNAILHNSRKEPVCKFCDYNEFGQPCVGLYKEREKLFQLFLNSPCYRYKKRNELG